jgi:hypothetical protein
MRSLRQNNAAFRIDHIFCGGSTARERGSVKASYLCGLIGDQRLAYRVIVNPAPGPRSGPPVHLSTPQQAHRMLAVKARHRRDRIEE